MSQDSTPTQITQSDYKTKRKGFTLIELSIVLVIIGLIVGGVLVGQDLIRAAEIRAQVSQVQEAETAMMTFRLKYNCLAGDCRNATQFFSAVTQPAQVTNGTGDKKITGLYEAGAPLNQTWWNFDAPSAEWASVFDHLAAAGLWNIPQYDETSASSAAPGIAYPKLKFAPKGLTIGWTYLITQGGMIIGYDAGDQHIKAGNKIRLGACNNVNGAYPGMGCGLGPLEAYAIDSKLDDGKPYTGRIVIGGPNTYVYRVPNTAQDETGGCGVYATNLYKLDTPTNIGGCAMIISAQF